MDEERYADTQDSKILEHEALCKRCGACCGVTENNPCEHLRPAGEGKYSCDIYEERFGLRKTVKGDPVLCVPVRKVLHKDWLGRNGCAYVKTYKI